MGHAEPGRTHNEDPTQRQVGSSRRADDGAASPASDRRPRAAALLHLQRTAGNRAASSLVVQRDDDDRRWYEYLGFESQERYNARQRRRIARERRRSREAAEARDQDPNAWALRYIGGPPRVYEQDEGHPRESSHYAGMPGRPQIRQDDLILGTSMSANTVRRVFPALARRMPDGPSTLDLALAVLGEAPPDYDVAEKVRRIERGTLEGDFRMTTESVVKLGETEVVPTGNERTYDRRSLESRLSTHNTLTVSEWFLAATAFVVQNSLPAARASLLANAGRAILGMGARAAVRTIGASVRRRLPRIVANAVRAGLTSYARAIQAEEMQNAVRGQGRTISQEAHDRAVARASTAAVNSVIGGVFGAATGLDGDSPIGDTLGAWFRGQVGEFIAVDFSTAVLSAMTNVATEDGPGSIESRLATQVGSSLRDALLQKLVGAIGTDNAPASTG